MYLFLGETDDALGRNLGQALEKRGAQVRALTDPFSESTRFSWRMDSTHTNTTLIFQDGTCLAGSDISGVFLRRGAIPGTNRVGSEDYSYIQAEIEAAILGWIWSLPCRVINRLPPWLWYCRKSPRQLWSRLLLASGLAEVDCKPEREAGSTNWDASTTFGIGDPSIVCCRVCVIGQAVVWHHAQPGNLDRYKTALIEFTRCAGLSFLEFVIAQAGDGIGVMEVNPFPDLGRFCGSCSDVITEELVKLFIDSERWCRSQ
jgi:hypothetical protein